MSSVKLTTTAGNGGTVELKGPANTTSNAAVQLTLPVDDGDADQYLKTDGSGTLSWSTVSSNIKQTISAVTSLSGNSEVTFTVPSNCFSMKFQILNMETASTSVKGMYVKVGGTAVTSGYYGGASLFDGGGTSVSSDDNAADWDAFEGFGGGSDKVTAIVNFEEQADNTWIFSSCGYGAGNFSHQSAGYVALSGEISHVVFKSNTGNFDGGTIRATFMEAV